MTSSTDELLPPGNDDLAIVFVHGFLDDRHTWDGVVNQLVTGVETIRVDLYGCGGQADASGPFSYDRLAAEVGAVVDRLGKPFVIVGQSMGAAIAELVAADRPETARGLVLLTQCRSQGPTCRTRPSSQHPAARRGWAGAGATVGQGVAVRRVPPADRDGRRRVDTWRRLKTCCNPRSAAFFDRSRNNSRVWHDVAVCGNLADLHAHRARKRAQANPGD